MTVAGIAELLQAEFRGPDAEVAGLSPLGEAGAGQLTFANDPVKAADAVAQALDAGAVVLVPTDVEAGFPEHGTAVLVGNPRAAFARVVAAFFAPAPPQGVDPTAIVHESAVIHPTASVGPYSVIREGVVIEEGVEVRAHVVLHRNVRIGAHSLIKSHAVIGEEGFGMETDDEGNNLRIPHIGSARLGQHVEVGNFTTVCSGTIVPTLVGDYTKIDDHVHISHNCRIGRNVIITACAELSGSVVVEDHAWVGPNASVIQGKVLGERSLLGIGAVAVQSVPANEVRIGNPARRIRDNA